MTCHTCDPDDAYVLCETEEARLFFPPHPHISPTDGGHLVVTPKLHVRSRRELHASARSAVDLLTLVAADALESVFGTGWFNFQENGNWGVDHPERQHMHIHVYGRTTDAVEQPFGEALRFPFRNELGDWHVVRPTASDRVELRNEATSALDRRQRA